MRHALIVGSVALFASMAVWADGGTTSSGIYNEEQAIRGKELYDAKCASCHGLDGITVDEYAPDLVAYAFDTRFVGQTVANRFDRIQMTMPFGQGGTLSDQEVVDILAYVLQLNQVPMGADELVPGDHLASITIEKPEPTAP